MSLSKFVTRSVQGTGRRKARRALRKAARIKHRAGDHDAGALYQRWARQFI